MWGSIASAVAGPLIAGLFEKSGARQQNTAQREAAEKQMQFQERLSNTAHQREVKDLRAAGLNPILSAKYGGASTPAGAQPNVVNENSGMVSSALQSKRLQADLENLEETAQLTREKQKTEHWNQDKLVAEVHQIEENLKNMRENRKATQLENQYKELGMAAARNSNAVESTIMGEGLKWLEKLGVGSESAQKVKRVFKRR